MFAKLDVMTLGLAWTIGALAQSNQSNVDPNYKFAWGENVGWTNWRDANGANDGVIVGTNYLEGFIWGENVGWINVGDGTPTNGTAYANVDGTDFGVNILGDDDLDGFAWGENIGWINFGWGAAGDDPDRARFDFTAGRFRGFAWGENVGWLNLDDSVHFVAACPTCRLYGDLVAPFCELQPDVDDLLCAVFGFGDLNACPNADIFPCAPDPCALDEDCQASVTGAVCINGGCRCTDDADCLAAGAVCNLTRQGGRCELVDVDDLTAMVQAFGGTFFCSHPCPP